MNLFIYISLLFVLLTRANGLVYVEDFDEMLVSCEDRCLRMISHTNSRRFQICELVYEAFDEWFPQVVFGFMLEMKMHENQILKRFNNDDLVQQEFFSLCDITTRHYARSKNNVEAMKKLFNRSPKFLSAIGGENLSNAFKE
ncbi:hypothetical protein PCE1_002670 [Barthelona sp. PCE]